MIRLDLKILSILEPIIHFLYKKFIVTILILVILSPFCFLYIQCIKNYNLIQETKIKVDDIPADLEIRKQIRVEVLDDLNIIKKQVEENNKLLKELKK